MIYFTADLHFGHNNIIRSCGRPFTNADEMDAALIENWNERVHADDKVYILGDVTMKGPLFAMEKLTQLKGEIFLIRGNHDGYLDKNTFEPWRYGWVKDYYELTYQNELFTMSHYPFLEWNRALKGSYMLHGHQHNHREYNLANRDSGILRYDVGVDANGYAPVSIDEILAFFAEAREGGR